MDSEFNIRDFPGIVPRWYHTLRRVVDMDNEVRLVPTRSDRRWWVDMIDEPIRSRTDWEIEAGQRAEARAEWQAGIERLRTANIRANHCIDNLAVPLKLWRAGVLHGDCMIDPAERAAAGAALGFPTGDIRANQSPNAYDSPEGANYHE